ncbi:hypothetical protein [Halostella salina]|uniref:hypothetical protein n=1 Tax=Halostella salina TaxID=1547897 RepID=UPI000EF7FF7B|nr:hypothetical protein [Halostella salina]
MTSADGGGSFVDEARRRVLAHARRRRQAGLTDVLYAVVRSTSGSLYDGTPFETSMPQFDFCAERHAINNMLHAEPETDAFTDLLVAEPVPDESTDPKTPCGACRHAILEFGDDATVYCASFVRESDGWTMFPRLNRYTAAELYPDHQDHPSWD